MPRTTSISAITNSINFAGKHKERRKPAPKAVKTSPLELPLGFAMSSP